MKPFAIAMCAYNPQLTPHPGSHINVNPLGKAQPLNCRVLVFMAENDAAAEQMAMRHCQKMFRREAGWQNHTVDVLDINRTLMQA